MHVLQTSCAWHRATVGATIALRGQPLLPLRTPRGQQIRLPPRHGLQYDVDHSAVDGCTRLGPGAQGGVWPPGLGADSAPGPCGPKHSTTWTTLSYPQAITESYTSLAAHLHIVSKWLDRERPVQLSHRPSEETSRWLGQSREQRSVSGAEAVPLMMQRRRSCTALRSQHSACGMRNRCEQTSELCVPFSLRGPCRWRRSQLSTGAVDRFLASPRQL